MRSRLILNLLLLLLVAGLAVYLFQPQEPDDKTTPLTRLEADRIETITLEREGLETIEFVNQNGAWNMQTPFALPANTSRMRQLLQLLSTPSITQLPVAGQDLQRFKLAAPQASVVFDNTRIDFGDTSPLNDNRYVRVDDTIHLIQDSLFRQLRTAPTFYLDNRPLPADRTISAIRLPDIEVINFDGEWTVKPVRLQEEFDPAQLAHTWQSARAITVRRYQPADSYGQVVVDFPEAPSIRFELVGDPGKPVLARTDLGIQYHLSGYDKKRLFPTTVEKTDNEDSAPPLTNH